MLFSFGKEHLEETREVLVVECVVVNFAHGDFHHGGDGCETEFTNKEDFGVLLDKLVDHQDFVEKFGGAAA